MINRLMDKKRRDEGFTLIELLIVVIILGILAAVVVFGVSTFRKDSATEACKTDVKSVETAAEAYRAKNSTYPQPVAATGTPPTGAKTNIEVLRDAGYLKAVPSSSEYTITLNSTNGSATGTLTGGGAC